MSLALAVSIIVSLDVVLLAGLAFAMSATRKLTPHASGSDAVATAPSRERVAAARRRHGQLVAAGV